MPLEVLVLLFAAVTACLAADLFDAGAPVHRAAVSALLVLFLLGAVYAVLNVAHRVGAEGAIPRERIAGWWRRAHRGRGLRCPQPLHPRAGRRLPAARRAVGAAARGSPVVRPVAAVGVEVCPARTGYDPSRRRAPGSQ